MKSKSKKNIYLAVLGLILLLPISLIGQVKKDEKDPIKILFVGNSFTFFWNMPQLVGAMAKKQGVEIESYQSTVGGSNLKQHWKSEKGTQTRKRIEEGDWDYVVFGDHSTSTIKTPERFNEYGRKFAKLVRSKGAEPIFYLTWAYKSNPLMQETITNGYMKLAKELNTQVFPVGPIWMKARANRPDLELYFDDKHPSPNGTYLIALIITKSLTGKSVLNIPNRLTTLDKNGEKLYLSFVLPTNGKFFRQLVEETNFEVYNK